MAAMLLLSAPPRAVPLASLWLLGSRGCSSSGPAVIRVPRGLALRAERGARRRAELPRPALSSLPGRLLLLSRRPELSQHRGHTHPRLGPAPRLVSGGWKHPRSAGDHFTLLSTCEGAPGLSGGAPEGAPGLPEEAPGFRQLGLGPRLTQALSALGIRQPTGVQRQAIPRLLRGNNALCAAETGSGKTLSYLLPLLHRLLGEEDGAAGAGKPGQQEDGGLGGPVQEEAGKREDDGDPQELITGTPGMKALNRSHPCTSISWKEGTWNHQPPGTPRQSDAAWDPEGTLSLDALGEDPRTWDTRALGHGSRSPVPPMMHRLVVEDVGPRSLVLVPSRELSDQVYAVASSLARSFGLRVRSVGGGRGMGTVQKALLSGQVDILVATPGALCKALRKDLLTLRELRFLVLDEADTLCDESFKDLVEEILQHVNIARLPAEATGPESKAQLVVIGATFPKGVGELLGKFTDLGTITTLKSKMLHYLMPHIKQKFLKVKGADKLTELLEMIKKQASEASGAGVLVFCNSASTVNWLGYIFDDHTIKHSRLQGQMPADMRTGIFNSFQKGLTDVLVCTDIASRGLDSTRVEVVINYDFPPTLQDYIHRAGRVGRVGSKNIGTVISFVTHKWDVELVQKIETAARKRTSLPGMESSIKQPISKTDLIEFDYRAEE